MKKLEDQRTLTVGSKSIASMWADVAAEVGKPTLREPPGEDWVKWADLPAAFGLGKTKTKDLIASLSASGRAERFQGSALSPSGVVKMQVWYRLK